MSRPMTSAEIAEVARQQNEADAAAGYCSRYVEDVGVLAQVAALLVRCEEGGADARSA